MVRRVLIVDDHELMRVALTTLMAGQPDLEVCGEADTEEDALRLIDEKQPHLAIIDVLLKQGSGLDLIRRAKEKLPSLRTLVVSAYDDRLFAEQALQAGALGYINKQNPAEAILNAARMVLDGDVCVSEEVRRRVIGNTQQTHTRAASPGELLSQRELEVFRLIGQGLTTRDIALRLHVSTSTVETHRERIKTKLGLASAMELNRRAIHDTLEQDREGRKSNESKRGA
jgi:DNA-binding NarL/FixJ family response regulator